MKRTVISHNIKRNLFLYYTNDMQDADVIMIRNKMRNHIYNNRKSVAIPDNYFDFKEMIEFAGNMVFKTMVKLGIGKLATPAGLSRFSFTLSKSEFISYHPDALHLGEIWEAHYSPKKLKITLPDKPCVTPNEKIDFIKMATHELFHLFSYESYIIYNWNESFSRIGVSSCRHQEKSNIRLLTDGFNEAITELLAVETIKNNIDDLFDLVAYPQELRKEYEPLYAYPKHFENFNKAYEGLTQEESKQQTKLFFESYFLGKRYKEVITIIKSIESR